MTRSLSIILAVTAALALFARSAEAQPTPATKPTPKQLKQARQHFEAAEKAKARGEYQTAAVEYLAAYEQFQEPEFFFNVAEVYRLAGDEPNALTYYEKYLELDPGGRGASTAREEAAQLRRSIAARQDALARAAAAAEEAKRKEEKRKEEEARRETAAAPNQVASPPERPGRSMRIAGMVAGGTGVVSLATGVIFGFKMKSIEDEIAKDTVYRPSRYADGEAAQRNMYLFSGIGVAAMVTGGVLYYLGRREAASAEHANRASVTIAPVVGPSQIALTAAGRF